MLNSSWLIYGASGYTAGLIIEAALKRGHQPILAGRSLDTVLPIATQHQLSYKIFSCQGEHAAHAITQQLDQVAVVLNCAGPFEDTADTLQQACIKAGCHYLDITGEMAVLAQSLTLHDAAREHGVAIISGIGFDVVPTDILASEARRLAPDADALELAFAGADRKTAEQAGGISPGTSKTMLRMMPEGGKLRRNAEIITVDLAEIAKFVQFADKRRFCMTIPWGDLVTAYHSAGFDNIAVYTEVSPQQAKWMKRLTPVVKLFKFSSLQRLFDRMIDKYVSGPDQAAMDSACMQLSAEASKQGQCQLRLFAECDEGYAFTAKSALYFVESLLAQKIMPGAYTPSQAIEPSEIIEMLDIQLTVQNIQEGTHEN